MSTISKSVRRGTKFPPAAYQFLFNALRHTQEHLGRTRRAEAESDEAHISGPELLDGVRDYALQQYGLLTQAVFRAWGIHATEDIGRMVFDLVERGEMRKTDRDSPTDFLDAFDFDDAFDRDYVVDTRAAFRR